MAKAFGALVKVIYDFIATELTPAARDLNVIYASLLATEIVLCLIISVIDIDRQANNRFFHVMAFLLGFVELCVLTVRGVMDIMDTNGVFYVIGDDSRRHNATSPVPVSRCLEITFVIRIRSGMMVGV
jgi:hypothetical protein